METVLITLVHTSLQLVCKTPLFAHTHSAITQPPGEARYDRESRIQHSGGKHGKRLEHLFSFNCLFIIILIVNTYECCSFYDYRTHRILEIHLTLALVVAKRARATRSRKRVSNSIVC